ncbi:uncharacterized protein LOC123543007 [Mercenaria mercenaria]|uniref:uncharacterized protein LOC123543007 n=1 Tax=Mercenaria mercenaria TaxID=6596 RepID=UPI00234EB93B|nr:uncharacterized protein LOC123543007 [Mercenaria mercenaria]XP_053398871.1 uncharacterized protein LOC123543007 [Mercenaria mercenaria]
MMQQHEEPKELKTRTGVENDGNVSREPDSTPSTPAAQNRFPLARTGRDSGYGTDYSPSPSSVTSTRHFVFNDEIIAGRNISTDNVSEMLSERLQTIQLGSRENGTVDGNLKSMDMTETDEIDEEVMNINANNSASCNFGLYDVERIERPSAPFPDPDTFVGAGSGTGHRWDSSLASRTVVRPLSRIGYRTNTTGTVDVQQFPNNDASPMSTVQTARQQNQSQIEHLTHDRSYSLPNVQVLQEESCEQAVGRQLRRLSDEFFHFHCHRRRRRALSVESSPFPLRVNIDIYAGTAFPDGRTDHDAEDTEEEANSRQSEGQ